MKRTLTNRSTLGGTASMLRKLMKEKPMTPSDTPHGAETLEMDAGWAITGPCSLRINGQTIMAEPQVIDLVGGLALRLREAEAEIESLIRLKERDAIRWCIDKDRAEAAERKEKK